MKSEAPATLETHLFERALNASLGESALPSRDQRHAAVAAILRDGALGSEVLLIRRASRDGDPWSGQMALPGGRHETGDADLCATALRETREEIGLDLGRYGRVLGRLPDTPAIARARRVGMNITPFVFELLEDVPLVTNEEVEETIWAPLSPIYHHQRDTTIDYQTDNARLTLPAWDVDGRIVWGLTYRMLTMLLDTVRGAP